MEFEATSVPDSTPSVIGLPPSLTEWLASNGEHCTLVWNSPKAIGNYRAYGFRVLMASQIPEHLRDEIVSELENPLEHYGKCVKGDAVIMVRTLRAQEQWRKVHDDRYTSDRDREMRSVEDISERVRSKSRSATRSPVDLIDIIPEKVYPIEAHVSGGAELAQKIRETLQQAGK